MTIALPEPNLVILGAQKSGTTSLHEYMKRHPDIFMSSPIKEPGYYLGEERAQIFWKRMGSPIESREQLLRERMLEGYAGEKWFGDASTYYTIDIRSRRFNIPQRMHAAHEDMRMIYIMRDPVERIVSNYWHCRAKGRAGENLREFLSTPEGHIALGTSRYHYQLKPYLEYFSKDQFCLLLFEDLLQSPQTVMDKIWKFLGVEPLADGGNYRAYNASEIRNDDSLKCSEDELGLLRKKLEGQLTKLEKVWSLDLHSWKLGAAS